MRKLAAGLALLASSLAHAAFPNNPTSAYPSVGMCGDWNGTSFTQWGSGVAVAPTWVLTARHVGGTHFLLNGTYYAVAQKFYHSGVQNADLALWKLATPVPAWSPVAWPDFVTGLQGQTVTFVGYGVTANQAQSGWSILNGTNGVKRASVNVIDQLMQGITVNYGTYTRTTDYIAYDLDDPAGQVTTNTWGGPAIQGEGGIASLDSGCPWFQNVNGTQKVVAVSSIVGYFSGSGVTSNFQYGAWGAGTFLTSYKSWMQTTAPELGTMTASLADATPEGTLVSGGVSQLATADGVAMRVRSRNLWADDVENPLGLRVGLTTQVVFPTTLDISATQRTLGGGARARIYVRNWITGGYDLVDSSSVSGTFSTRDVLNVSAAGHVRADGRIEVRVGHDNFAIDSEFIDMEIDMVRVVAKT